MPHVLITGATGFLGQAVTARFLAEGWSVAALSRDPAAARARLPASVEIHSWPARRGADTDPHTLFPEQIDVVVHLAGESIAGGWWTAARKAKLRTSRVDATRSLIAALSRLDHRPNTFVSASGMGYYGDRGGANVRVDDPPGRDFLGVLAAAWEHEVQAAESIGARVVTVRLGMILGNGGGALPKMAFPFRLGLGAVMGSGRQYWPWIHLADAAELFFRAATRSDIRGPVHGVAGEPVTQQEFSKILAGVLRRPLLFWVPAWALRLGAGEMADLFLHGQRAAADARLEFRYPTLEEALLNLLRPAR
jgi:uncharacterized protein